jgi:diguanylate cyclase (GGDEF)-like protein
MASAKRTRALALYVCGISVLGGVAFGVIVSSTEHYAPVASNPAVYVAFAALLVVAEWSPLAVRDETGQSEMVASTTFAFALLIGFGLAPVLVVQSFASLVTDAARRKAWRKMTFNVGQYTLSFGASALVLRGAGDRVGLFGSASATRILQLAVAALAFFIVNNLLVGIAIALDDGLPLLQHLADEMRAQAGGNIVLLALAPIAVVVADRSLWLVPLLLLPVLLVYRSAQVTLDLEYQARYDGLTALPNRFLFKDRAVQALKMARRTSAGVAVMLIDLDRFKEVNDTLGHAAGDKLLVEMGRRLTEASREIDTVARLGGDEFAVLVPGLRRSHDAKVVAARLARALEAPFVIDGLRVDVEASIGISLYPADGLDVDALLQHADVAMYVAKRSTVHYELYSSERDHHSRLRLSLLGEMRGALANGDLILHYQPKVDLSTGEVVSVEALVRWQHPRYGLLSPAEFVPLAENTGLIAQFTRHVLREAVAQIRRWRDAGLDLPVAVNLSARNLCDAGLPADVAELLAELGVDAHRLELEITETTLMSDPVRAERTLIALADMGVRIAIDDFGTGYSSLAYLRRLPVREVKIDRSFVAGMQFDENDRIIVRSTIDLARNLGLDATAEGVEDDESLAMLRTFGCEFAQGFHLSHPLPANEIPAWVASRPKSVAIDLSRAGERVATQCS